MTAFPASAGAPGFPLACRAVRGKDCASVRRFGLLSTPRGHAARSPSTRHGASKVRATRCPPARRHGGCFACAPPLRVTPIARRGYWRPRRFAAEAGRSAVSVSKTSWVQKAHRGGGGSRLAKRSGATGEAGLALRRARLAGSPVFGICVYARARFLSLNDLKPAKKRWISPCFVRFALLAIQFTLISPDNPAQG